ncbi:free fatty acid receptor 4 isoform X2 [Numida meleagris]|uniref:free fatty acid receptor 4 isoform X2 n=1 Tax=Numida meleagris TaxID=8996 RepID=UPI000B3D88EF|nr:free fatty acid receptor 4 isoform X2 [Numida meleagris]
MVGAGGTPGENKTYFPFFSDFRGGNVTALRVGESAALGCIFLLALVGNIWGICLLVWRQQRLCAANYLVLNLFCADLLFITAIPFIAIVRWTENWVLGDVICHMLFYVMTLSGTVVIVSLSAVSLERVISIAQLHHTAFRHRRRRKLLAAALLIWGFAAIVTLPLCCFFTVVQLPSVTGEEIQICTLDWPSHAGEIVWDVTYAVVVFLIPGLIIVISYSKILQFLSFTADYKSIKKKFKCWIGLLRKSPDSCFPARLQTIPSPHCADDLLLHHVEPNYHNYFFYFSPELQTRYFAIRFLLDSAIHFCQLCCQPSFI